MPRSSIDVGRGVPIVLIPGVQGRWEWMRTTIAVLSRRFRVLALTLAGERTADQPLDPRLGFDTFIAQVDRLLDRAGIREAILCGVSYGGLIALRYAAERPDRTRALILVSTPPPDYRPDAVVEQYLRTPWLRSPLFMTRATQRGCRELLSALPTWRQRVAAAARQAWHVLSAPMAPRRMRDRVRLIATVDFLESVRRCRDVPALLVTGDPALDEVVAVHGTLRYRDLLNNVTVHRLEGTGHLGTVLRPDAFADAVEAFVAGLERRRDARSQRAG